MSGGDWRPVVSQSRGEPAPGECTLSALQQTAD